MRVWRFGDCVLREIILLLTDGVTGRGTELPWEGAAFSLNSGWVTFTQCCVVITWKFQN